LAILRRGLSLGGQRKSRGEEELGGMGPGRKSGAKEIGTVYGKFVESIYHSDEAVSGRNMIS